MSKPILEVKDLTKWYGEYQAVDHISFAINEGEVWGLLGANGAGKSTTIQMLVGLTTPDSGTVSYFGKDFSKHKTECLADINFASAYIELQGRMSIYQNLRVYAELYQIPNLKHRIEEVLDLLEITDLRDKMFWHLSSGQKTRAILAKSLLNKPKMLLMDEPTASLDPEIVTKIIALIKHLQEHEKVTILYTSHNMEEVARLCNRIAFLAKGKIVMEGTPQQLIQQVGTTKLLVGFQLPSKPVTAYLTKQKYAYNLVQPNLVEIAVPDAEIPKILFGLKEEQVWITSISTERPSLEDVFLHVSQENRK